MSSFARAILVPKAGHHLFEDRVLSLEPVPAKIGRSHKEDQVMMLVMSVLV